LPGALTTLRASALLAGRYELVELLDTGGAGQVWLAADRHLDGEPVCCKVLLPEWARHPSAVNDLKREVIVTRRLRHQHIRQVYTFWDTEGLYFITMEFVRGTTLAHALGARRRPFLPSQVAAWAVQLADALDYAHVEGVLHRDVKPGNVLLAERGQVSLADFGIAEALSGHARGASQTCGTPRYMSPEQIRGQRVGARSDQYSLATLLYELLAGHPPFHEGAVVEQIQLSPAPPLRRYGPEVEAVFAQALRKAPAERFPSCMAFAQALAAAAAVCVDSDSDTAAGWFNPATEEVHTVVLPGPDGAAARSRLGCLLVDAGLLTDDELDRALEVQRDAPRERLGKVLVRLGLVTERQIARTLARQLKLDFMETLTIDPVSTAYRGSFAALAEEGCVLLRRDEHGLLIAMTDPLRIDLVNTLEAEYRAPARIVLCTESALRAALES